MPISDYLKRLREKVGNELLLVPSVIGIVYDEQGCILLVKHSEGEVWVTPGGSIEPNESPADAIVREMWEETGLLVEPTRIIGVYGGPEFLITYRNGDQVTYLMTVFECRVLEGQMQADGVETLDLAFFSQSDLDGLKVPTWAQVVLPDAFRERGRTYFSAPRWRPGN